MGIEPGPLRWEKQTQASTGASTLEKSHSNSLLYNSYSEHLHKSALPVENARDNIKYLCQHWDVNFEPDSTVFCHVNTKIMSWCSWGLLEKRAERRLRGGVCLSHPWLLTADTIDVTDTIQDTILDTARLRGYVIIKYFDLTLFYTQSLGIVVLHVMVPEPYSFLFAFDIHIGNLTILEFSYKW